MALTAEIFKQLVQNLTSDQGRKSKDLRTRPRVGVHGRIDVRPIVGGKFSARPLSVWVKDLSIDGIGILHSKALAKETRFVAYFPRTEGEAMALTYVVAYTKRVSKDLYVVGGKLSSIGAEKSAAA